MTSDDDTLRDIAAEAARALGPGHVAEPHDRWRPQETAAWYILKRPLGQRPFYRYAKGLLFEEDGLTVVGFYFEKGLGPEAEKPAMRMNEEWSWSGLLKNLRLSALGTALREGAAAVKRDPLLLVAAGVPGNIPKSLDYRRLRLHDDGELELQHAGLSGPGIVDIPSAHDIRALADTLDALPQPNWTWIDLILGVIFDARPSPMQTAAFLRPFGRFL